MNTLFASDAERGRVRVHVIEDFDFRADETAYLFVLFNLIKNALYYMALDPGARITITVADNQVMVHDTGPGVAPDALARLFQPFALGGQGRRHRPGPGLLPPRHAGVWRRDRVRFRSGRIHAVHLAVPGGQPAGKPAAIIWRSWNARLRPSPASGC